MTTTPTAANTIQVPYVDLALQHQPLKPQLLAAAAQVIDSGRFILGPQVAQFEQAFAQLCGARFAVGVNSGTDALILSLRALNFGPGDEVITAANSFVASASCIALVGATPILVDAADDMNIDPAAVERAITPKTRAIIPVHLTGRPADFDALAPIAKKHNLFIIEDAAQAVLAEHRSRRVGSLGTLGCFSLHPLKTLSALGDAGVITTSDPALDQKLRLLRNLGLRTREQCETWSPNSRLDTLQAAMLLVKLDYLQDWTAKRRENAAFYQKTLAGIDALQLPADKPHEKSVYHTFVIHADRRDDLKNFLASQGVQTAVHYPIPIHLQHAASSLNYHAGAFPVAERHATRILSLPIYPELTHDQLSHVAAAIRRFYQN